MADASPDSKVVQDQLKKNEKTKQVGERNRRASFSKSSPQLQQKLEKRLEKEKFAESVASFSGASNIEGITESEIDKSLSNKKNAVAKHFDAPSSELEGKLRKRRQSMAGIKMEDPKSTQKMKKKSTATTSSSSSLDSATTDAAATTTTTTTRSNATDTPTSQKSPPQKSPPLILLAVLLFFSLLAWFLFSKFSKRPDHHH